MTSQLVPAARSASAAAARTTSARARNSIASEVHAPGGSGSSASVVTNEDRAVAVLVWRLSSSWPNWCSDRARWARSGAGSRCRSRHAFCRHRALQNRAGRPPWSRAGSTPPHDSHTVKRRSTSQPPRETILRIHGKAPTRAGSGGGCRLGGARPLHPIDERESKSLVDDGSHRSRPLRSID